MRSRSLFPALACAWMQLQTGCASDDERPARDAAVTDASHARDARVAASKDAATDMGATQDAGLALEPWRAALPSARGPACPAARLAAHDDDDDDDAGIAAAATTPKLTTGPHLGAMTDDSMRVWLRSAGPADVCIEYWPEAGGARHSVLGPQLRAASDFTGAVLIGGLEPSTRYAYRVLLASAGGNFVATDGAQTSFTTAPEADTPSRFRLVWGADVAGASKQPIFTSMQAQAPDVVLLLGDLFYSDNLEVTLATYRGKAGKNWQIPALTQLAASTPTLAMWDDHDIVDNYWQGKDELAYAGARQTFDEYDAARNPTPVHQGELYFTTRFGDVDMFVLDVRTHRSSNELSDDANKTMLGKAQRDALFAWLVGSTAKVKLIASPVLFADHSKTRDDAWEAFSTEREQIYAFIIEHRIDDVLLLSGDQHWAAIFKHTRGIDGYAFYEFQATPLSKDPGTPPTAKADDILVTFGSHGVYGVVDIDTREKPASIALTLCVDGKACDAGHEPAPVSGKAPFTLHLTTDDLGFRDR